LAKQISSPIKGLVRPVIPREQKAVLIALKGSHQMHLSGNFKFNLDLGQLLTIVASILSIVGSLITIAMLL
jgi:hypothetical protein